MKNILTTFALLIIAFSVSAQKGKGKGGYERIFYFSKSTELGPLSITLDDCVSNDAYLKFKMRITNNSADYIILKTNDIVIKAAGRDNPVSEKDMLIGPKESETKVIDIKGGDLRVNDFQVVMKGFSSVPADAPTLKADNFKLPIATNDITIGNFKVMHMKNTKKTDVVAVTFMVNYSGKQVGIVDPGKVALKTTRGTEWANMMSPGRRKPFLVTADRGEDFTVEWKNIPVSEGDMQFANVEILWRDAFREATPKPLGSATVDMTIDPGMTAGKNK